MKNYQIVSPSLDGILYHGSIVYEGIHRPEILKRVMDRGSITISSMSDRKMLDQYFSDLYAVFMKKLTAFATGADAGQDEGLKMQALLQEMIKVKRLCSNNHIQH